MAYGDNPLFGGKEPKRRGIQDLAAEHGATVCAVDRSCNYVMPSAILMNTACRPELRTHSPSGHFLAPRRPHQNDAMASYAAKKGLLWRKEEGKKKAKWHLHWFELRDSTLRCYTSVPDSSDGKEAAPTMIFSLENTSVRKIEADEIGRDW